MATGERTVTFDGLRPRERAVAPITDSFAAMSGSLERSTWPMGDPRAAQGRADTPAKMTRQQTLVVFTLLFIGSFANMDKSMIGLAVTGIARDFHLRPSDTGVILSVFYISSLAVTVPGGWVVDRYGYRRFVLVALGLSAVGSLLFGAVSGLTALAVVRLLVGFGQAGYMTGSPKIISDNFDQAARGGVQAEVIATAGVGGVLAYTAGAFLVSLNWRLGYFALALLYAVAFALMLVFVPEPPDLAEQARSRSAAPQVRFSEAWKNWNTIVLAVALLFNNLVGVALVSWLPSVLAANMHVPLGTDLNLIMIGNSVVMGAAMVFAGRLIGTRFAGREKAFMLVCSACSAGLLVAFITAHQILLSVALLYLATALTVFAFTAILALPYRLVPARIIGSAFAVITMGAFVGGIAQGELVGQLASAAGGSFVPAFLFLAVAIMLAGLVPYLLREPGRRGLVPRVQPDRALLAHISCR